MSISSVKAIAWFKSFIWRCLNAFSHKTFARVKAHELLQRSSHGKMHIYTTVSILGDRTVSWYYLASSKQHVFDAFNATSLKIRTNFGHKVSLQTRDSRHQFEENSQDFFLLREFQNIREGPDTCICQRRFQIQSFKKTRVFRKADMTAWMEQELFYTQGRLGDRSEASLFPECFTCSSSSFLWTTRFNTLLNTIQWKNKTMRQKQGNSLHI